MKHFIVHWKSDGNIPSGKPKLISGKTLEEAQDNFFSWLREQPIYKHLWNLEIRITEVED